MTPSSKLPFKLPESLLLLALTLLMLNVAWAATPDTNSLKSQQHRLESLTNELEAASEHRQQTTHQLKQLKHKLDCNWTLIRAYEVCGQLYGENPDEHVKCSSTAKNDVQSCLNQGVAE
ncbi:MAG: hypothetical protein COB30_000190 [Ectothiorhodospiraceae bacterium]|nr:hypothetical protein [Ectothiorhodospiraceae bacterium]